MMKSCEKWPGKHRPVAKVVGGLLIGFLFFALFQPAAANSDLSDDFNGPTLNTNLWTFINPLGDSTISMTGSQASIAVRGGTAHYTGSGINTAPRIMQVSQNDNFEIEAKFDTAVSPGKLQGVRIEQDLNNSLTVQFQNTGSGQQFVYIHVIDGIAGAPVSAAVPNGKPLYLRVARQGNQWTLSYMRTLPNWITTFQFDREMNVTAVGVLAGNLPGSRVPAHTALIDYFYKRTPPIIEQQPADVSVTDPDAATFTVVASGTVPLSYQWRRDGATVPGATGATYTLSPTALADNGAQFDVVITNAYGSVVSQPATLTVNPNTQPPTITQQPLDATVNEPDAATFTVSATGGAPLSYQWRRDGVDIAGATDATYVLSPTSTADDGAQFDVVVTNPYGSATSQPATLTVTPYNGPPTAVDDVYFVAAGGVLDTALEGLPGVLDNDTDPETDPLTAVLVDDVQDGTLTLNPDGSFIYTPDWISVGQELLPGADSLIEYGLATAVDGDTLVVGSNSHNGNQTHAGAAYVFIRQGTTWQLQAKLLPNVRKSFQFFGWAVDVMGDTVVVGAPGDSPKGMYSGAAYVFTRNGVTWTQQAKLVGQSNTAYDEFGVSVSIDGDTVAVGAHLNDQAASNAGAAYVFTRSGATWTQQVKLVPPDLTADTGVGADVSIDNDSLAVGAYADGPTDAGAAYVFTRSGSVWSQEAKLTASDGGANQTFGFAVALQDQTLVVGANGYQNTGGFPGAAYIFQRNGIAWSEQQKLTPDGSGNGLIGFGVSVAIDDDTVLVGAHGDDQMADNAGAAYVYTWNGLSWSPQDKLFSADASAAEEFGSHVSLDGNTIAVGANSGKFNATMDGLPGAAYVFEVNGATSDSFTYVASDGTDLSNTALVSITINGSP
jgi:hypothetical protein